MSYIRKNSISYEASSADNFKPSLMKIFYTLQLCIISFLVAGCYIDSEDSFAKTNKSEQKNGLALTKSEKTYPYVQEFENFVNSTMAETGIPGAAVAIIKDNEVLLLKGYGVKAFGSTDSVNTHTVFRIASVSKGFASMLAGILEQDHLFKWDDYIQKYLPDFSLKNPVSASGLTIRHILSHTSGLPLHTFTNMIEEDVPYAKLREKLATIDCIAPVGSVYSYQNVIYSLIGDVAQNVTHKPYADLLEEKIFSPLGMADASATYKDLLATNDLALPHARRRSNTYAILKNTHHYYSVAPAAGVNASISDMAQWLQALVGNREDVISAATLHDLFSPAIKTPKLRKYCFFRWPDLKSASYGLGWRVLDVKGETVAYHGGHVRGYRAEVAVYPKDKVAIAILVNASGKLANDGVGVFLEKYFEYKRANH